MNLTSLTINGHNIIVIVFISFILSLILVEISKLVARHIGAMDKVNDKQSFRRIHKSALPRIGGLGIFFSFLITYLIFGEPNVQMISIFVGAFILIFVGLIDDINDIKQRYKLISHFIAAAVLVFYGGLVFNELTFFGMTLNFPPPMNYIVTIFFIVGAVNCINLIDGIDGLSSGIGSIYFLTIGIIAVIMNQFGGLDIILSFIMLGATLGFLVHNFPPATTFIGDCGSQFLGFMIAVIALIGYKGATLTTLFIPIIILAIPILDTLFAIIRRVIKKQPIGQGDKEHLHHQLLNMKLSPRSTVLIIYAICAMFAAVSIFYVLGNAKISIIIYVTLLAIFIFFVAKTDILFHHKSKDEKIVANVKKKRSKGK